MKLRILMNKYQNKKLLESVGVEEWNQEIAGARNFFSPSTSARV